MFHICSTCEVKTFQILFLYYAAEKMSEFFIVIFSSKKISLCRILQSSPSHTAVVKTSYVRVKQNEEDEKEEDCICFTVGKNLFYFTYSAFKQVKL